MIRRTLRTRHSTLVKITALATSAAMGFATLTASAPNAQADEVSSSPKGIVGGALLGGEVVTIVESLVGVRSGAAYAVGFGLGAIGGGIGGYFVDQSSSDGRASTYLLAGGLALVIPAIVLTLNATRYRASEDATEDHPPVNAPEANPGAPGGSSVIVGPSGTTAGDATPASPAVTMPPPAAGGSGTPTPTTTPATPPAAPGPPAPPLSLLDVQRGSFRMGLPVPEVRQMYSLREQKQYGLPQRPEVRMPVFAMTF